MYNMPKNVVVAYKRNKATNNIWPSLYMGMKEALLSTSYTFYVAYIYVALDKRDNLTVLFCTTTHVSFIPKCFVSTSHDMSLSN